MMRCLDERRLFLLHINDGTSAERAHLRLCADCAERYDALVDDLARIGSALKSPPPRMLAPARPFSPRAPQLVFVGAGVMIAVVALASSWLLRPAPMQVAAAPANVGAFVDEVSVALFQVGDSETGVSIDGDISAVRTALSGRYPCTTAQSLSEECDDELSALLNHSID
jgi:hypothetical protein